jgi:uncharacterized OB-fold protein
VTDDQPKPTRFEPPETEAARAFWEASREQRFVLPWCNDCGEPFWYPREVCPRCRATNVEWRDASGRGRVYAVSVQHRPGNPLMADRVPYAVALVDLDEGPRMMSNVVGCAPDDVVPDLAVEVSWEQLSDGRHLPLFQPA